MLNGVWLNSIFPNKLTCCQATGETPLMMSIAAWSPAPCWGLPQRLVLAQQILQEIDRFQERCIIDTTGEFQIREQVPQIAFEGERQLGVMSPLATRLVEFNVAHKVGNHREAFWFKQGKRGRLYFSEWCVCRYRRIDKQIQHLPSGLKVLGCLDHRSLRCLFRGELGCLLVLIDKVNKCLDQIIVNLTKAMISEAQQVQTCGCNRNPLQLVDRVELDQGGIVFYTLVGDSGGHEKSMGKFV